MQPHEKLGPNSPKLGSIIAEKIEKEILGRGWPLGTVLATEAELADHFHVSRATIREAVGQIERRGLATMRRGNRGGLVVSAPARSAVVRSLANYLELANADYEEMLDARLLLEMQAAALAADSIDARGIQLLRAHAQQLNLRIGTIEDDTRMHMAIRETIAEVTGNPLLALLIEALDFSSREVTLSNLDDPHVYDDVIERTSAIKRELVAAIIDCDKASAQQLVQRDVALQKEGYRAAFHSKLSADPPNQAGNFSDLKVPHALAIRISQDIKRNNWRPGQRIGAEVELMKHYGLSRSAFREAIRLLESLSVVKMQRGGAGGLIVGEPDASYTIDTAARYIDHMMLHSSHLHQVREALEIGAVQLAARAATAEDINRLRSALHAAALATEPEDLLHKPIEVHLSMCRASHNSVISLMTQLVLKAISNTYDVDRLSIAMIREVGASHEKIVGAIIARDESMAKRLMLQHLAMIEKWSNIRGQTILKIPTPEPAVKRPFLSQSD